MVRNCAPENPEIPEGAIAPLRFELTHRPGMTMIPIQLRFAA
jgi:hypothetical protein